MPGPDTIVTGLPGWVVAGFQYAIGREDRSSIESAQIRAAREAGYTGTREQLIAVGQGLRSADAFAAGQGGGPGSGNRGVRAGPPVVVAPLAPSVPSQPAQPAPTTPPISAVVPATPAFPTTPTIPGVPGMPGGGSIADRFPGLPESLPLPGVGGFLGRVLAPVIAGVLFYPVEAGRGSDLRDIYGVWNVPATKKGSRTRRGRRRRALAPAVPRPFALPGPRTRPVVRPSSGPVTISRPRAGVLNPPLALPSRPSLPAPVPPPLALPSRPSLPAPVPPPPPATNARVGDVQPQWLPAPSTVPAPAVPAPAAPAPFAIPSWLPLLASLIGPALFPVPRARPSALTYGIPGVSSPGLSPGISPGVNPWTPPSSQPLPALNPLTALQPAAVPYAQAVPQTQTDRCNCAKTKQRKKKSKPRSVCYSGTFVERSKGLSKTRKRKVKCK